MCRIGAGLKPGCVCDLIMKHQKPCFYLFIALFLHYLCTLIKQKDEEMNKDRLSQVVWLFLLSLVILFGLSLLPPLRIGTYETRKIDMLSDLRDDDDDDEAYYADEYYEAPEAVTFEPVAVTDSGKKEAPDSIAAVLTVADTIASDAVRREERPVRRVGDIVPIEDYTEAQAGLRNMAVAMENLSGLGRPARILFLGDSFIEADILTQHIRELLQQRYGGNGVGYMALHSDFPGFRRSVTQSDKGWESRSVVKEGDMDCMSLTLQYYLPGVGSYTRYKGSSRYAHAESWEVSRVVYDAKGAATLTLETDSGRHTYEIAAGEGVGMVTLYEPSERLTVRCDSADVALWGVWLDGATGVAVDNVSMRGYSGGSIADIPRANIEALQEAVPYDMVVLQYGLNRMSSGITDYSGFTKELKRVVAHLREAMPGVDILLMGIGDRCENRDGEMKTMKEVYAMRRAQRAAARESGCLFWDTCEAMKYDGGMTRFVENGWANKDYTHISHAGGRPLARAFVRAMGYALGDSVIIEMTRAK